MFKKPVTWIVLLLISMLTFVYWPSAEKNESSSRGNRPAMVETAKANIVQLKDEIIALGTTQANESIVLNPQSTDRVQLIHFDDGDKVAKSQLLVTLEHGEEIAEVNELEIRLAEQSRQLQRLLNINKNSAPAESAIDSQKSLMEATNAQLSVAQIRLSEKFIYAPFKGQLGLRQISPGQLLTTTTEITSLDDLSQIKVEFQLPEKFLNRVKIGQSVQAKNIAYNAPFYGEITSIATRLDEATRSFKVRAIFANDTGQLRAGMLFQLVVETKAVSALTVPESAIIPINTEHYVYRVVDNTVSKILVEIGRRKPGLVEILSGLNEGDVVVSQGVIKVRDGSTVKTVSAVSEE